MALLALVRHGESEGNKQGVFAGGGMNVHLTHKGRQQARGAGRAIRDIPIHRAFTSALVRTHETLQELLVELGADPEISHHHELNERHWGAFEGQSHTVARTEDIFTWRTTLDQAPPNAETFADVEARLVPFFEKSVIPELEKGQNVLVVGHGSLFRILRRHLEQSSIDQLAHLGVNNAEVILYEYANNSFQLVEKRSNHTEETERKD